MNYVSFTESVLNFDQQNSILFCECATESVRTELIEVFTNPSTGSGQTVGRALFLQQPLTTHHVDPHRDDDDRANRHHLAELGNFHQVHAVANHGISTAPSKLPQILPRPPNSDVPPKMTAAIASNSKFCAILPLDESMRPIKTIAPKAQDKPLTT